MFLYCTGGSFAAILFGTELGVFQRILHTTHLTLHQWLVCIVVGLAIVPVSEARRIWLQRRGSTGGATEISTSTP
jgi:Ca2+-transporting ATPase